MNILLLNPPVSRNSEPPLGIALIHAYLSGIGQTVTSIDLNAIFNPLLAQSCSESANPRYHRAFLHVGSAVSSLREPATYGNISRYVTCMEHYAAALRSVSDGNPWQISPADYNDIRFPDFRPETIRSALHSTREEIFDELFTRIIGARQQDPPEITGISVTYRSQFFPALLLLSWIRKRWPGTRIVWGGALMRCLPGDAVDCLRSDAGDVFMGSGQSAFAGLLGLDAVVTDDWIDPDYSDLHPDAYLSPGPVIPVTSSLGCYYGNCAFCPECREAFRAERPDRFMDRLHRLNNRYRPVLFHLTDNAIPPRILDRLADEPSGCAWYGFVRSEKRLTDRSFVTALAENGCRLLQLGIETPSQALLDGMAKGISIENTRKILDNLRHAGIQSYCYFLFGLPGQTLEHCESAIGFIRDNPIDFINASLFQLPEGSPIHRDPSSFGLGDIRMRDDGGMYYDYANSTLERKALRKWMAGRFYKDPVVRRLKSRTPRYFKSNHAPFMKV